MLSKGSLVEPSHKKRRSASTKVIMDSANNPLTEVHMTMGKLQDKNNEEEEPVDTN